MTDDKDEVHEFTRRLFADDTNTFGDCAIVHDRLVAANDDD